MNKKNTDISPADAIVENITRTLLYEGYSLFPYHRSAVKNQKPIPFGVVYPQRYNAHNEHAHSKIQTECIITRSENPTINISVRFLHLKTIQLFKFPADSSSEENLIPVPSIISKNKTYQAGWQTLERKISTGNIFISKLTKERKVLPINFEEVEEVENIKNEKGKIIGERRRVLRGISGSVAISAVPIKKSTFKVSIGITNTTLIQNTVAMSRDEAFCHSFLSTHTILKTGDAKFISDQSPEKKWEEAIAECKNIDTWPILMDKENTTILSSPIIVYDHPQINPNSPGDLFDSTEIEEALLLHVNVMSDDEKKRISDSDERLQNMLQKVHQITPDEMINYHGIMRENFSEEE